MVHTMDFPRAKKSLVPFTPRCAKTNPVGTIHGTMRSVRCARVHRSRTFTCVYAGALVCENAHVPLHEQLERRERKERREGGREREREFVPGVPKVPRGCATPSCTHMQTGPGGMTWLSYGGAYGGSLLQAAAT